MRRELGVTGIVLLVIALVVTNNFINIDYNLNIFEYIALSSDITAEERAVLKSYGTLTYGGNITEPPLGKYYEDTDQYYGLMTDLIYALSLELETEIEMRPLVWEEALEALKEGEIDFVDLTPSPNRSKDYLFTNRIYDLNGSVLINSEDAKTIIAVEDLNGISVAVQSGDYVIESLYDKNIYPNFVYTDNLTEAMSLLENGEVKAIVGDEPVIKNHLNDVRNVSKYEILPEKIYESYTVLGLPKTHEDLKPILNKAIFKMKKSGILQKIQGKWLGTDSANEIKRTNEKMKSIVFVVIALFGILLYLIFAWNRNLKKLVDERTLDLRQITDEHEIILNNIKSTIILVDPKGKIRKATGKLQLEPQISEIKEGRSIEDHAFLKSLNQKYYERTGHRIYEAEYGVTFEFSNVNHIYQCHVTPVDSKQELVLIIISDETLERIQKAQIFQSNKMAAVGRLAAGIAHELRNPLGTIRNSSYILKDTADLDQDHAIAINSIERSVSRASQIIESLLKYSRLDEGQDTSINISHLLEEQINYYKKSPENRAVKFKVEVDPKIYVISKENALRHIITNLVGNGIEAMNREGQLSVVVREIENDIEISVEDEGMGISEEQIEQIFDPFYTTKKKMGMGTRRFYCIHTRNIPSRSSIYDIRGYGQG